MTKDRAAQELATHEESTLQQPKDRPLLELGGSAHPDPMYHDVILLTQPPGSYSRTRRNVYGTPSRNRRTNSTAQRFVLLDGPPYPRTRYRLSTDATRE